MQGAGAAKRSHIEGLANSGVNEDGSVAYWTCPRPTRWSLAPPNNSDDGGITSEDAQHKQGGSSV